MTLKELIELVIKKGGSLDSKIILNYSCSDDWYSFCQTLDNNDNAIVIDFLDEDGCETDKENIIIHL